MKTILYTLLVCSLAITTCFAQNIEGIATYKTDRQVDLKMNKESGMTDDMQKQIQAQLREQFQKEYSLTFNTTESIYEEVTSLAAPKAAPTSGIEIMISGNSDVLYKNTKEETYTNQSEIMDKPFLIQDVLKKPLWKLEKETKNIGEYLCFKAIKTDTIQHSTFNEELQEFEEVEKERITTVWYTLQIPVSHGPGNFWGLPGLVLEVNDGELTVLCSKIILNPKNGINIEIPKKGKKVTQDEFEKIQEDKNKEMMERFHSRKKKKGDKNMTIEIRG